MRTITCALCALLLALVGCGGGGGPSFVVLSMTPEPGSTLGAGPTEIVVVFTEDLDGATVTAETIRVLGSGGDGTFEDGNEVLVAPASVTVTGPREATLTFAAALPADAYQVVVAGKQAGRGLDFDGVDDFVHLPANPVFAPGGGSWSVELWVALDGLDRANIPITCADFDFGNGWRLIQEPGAPINKQFYFIVESETPGDCIAAIGGGEPAVGAWIHVAGVYNSATGEICLYVDGELAALDGSGPVGAITPVSDMFFSRYYQASKDVFHHMDGRLDEIRIWNRARTQTEIMRDKNRVLRGDENGLVGYWRFEEGGGQQVRDASTIGTDGSLGDDGQAAADDPARIESTAWPVVCNGAGNPLNGGADFTGTFTVQ